MQNLIKEADYQLKYQELSAKIKGKEGRLAELAEAQDTRKNVEKRIADFRKIIENGVGQASRYPLIYRQANSLL